MLRLTPIEGLAVHGYGHARFPTRLVTVDAIRMTVDTVCVPIRGLLEFHYCLISLLVEQGLGLLPDSGSLSFWKLQQRWQKVIGESFGCLTW